MRLLSILHRWTGAFIGLLLAVLGLTGAILVWEGQWIQLPGAHDSLAEKVPAIARIIDQAAAQQKLSRVTLANEEMALHQLVFADGSGAYVRQNGELVDRWTSQWERPELWLFDLHHHLFAGETGETVAGIAGMAGLLFVLTGTILWWRSRRRFSFRLWPNRFAPGPIVAHHRDLGIVVAPVLLISFTTGVLMLFAPLRETVVGTELRPRVEVAQAAGEPSIEWILRRAKARFPNAELRRITLPRTPGDPISIRMRQPREWTPNGRTQLTFDARTGALLSVEDAARGNRAAGIAEKLYPIHTAKVGGIAMKLPMTASGLGLFLLGSLATCGFWARPSKRRQRARLKRQVAVNAGEGLGEPDRKPA
jgi:uncharacterized iron-regulated membrane protein